MDIKQRRFFYSIFITIFVVVAPLVVLYTIGYRYNLQKGKVEEIGVLFLNVLPNDADLKLNNELLATTRPLRLTNLKPNYYTVSAEKKGYSTWAKNLEVKSKESTIAYDIVLFKNTTPVLIDKNNPQNFALSPKGDILAVLDSGNVWQINLMDDKKTNRAILNNAPAGAKLKWSADGKFLLLLDEADEGKIAPLIIEMTGAGKNYDLKKISPNNFEKIIWHPSSNRLLGLVGGNLYDVDFLNNSSKLITSGVSSFAVTNDEIYLAKNLKDGTKIYKYNKLNIFSPIEEITGLPLENYQIKEYKNNFLSLNDSKNQIYLVDLSDANQPLLRLNGRDSIWGEGAKNAFLYYFDKSELWVFDPQTKKSYMLNRYDEDIKNVIPLYNIPYFILQLNDKLLISELDDRDKRQALSVFEGTDLQGVTTDKESAKIYFQYKLKEGYGIFEKEIQ